MKMIMAIEHSGIAITADVIKTKLLDLVLDDSEVGNAFLSRGQHHSKNFKVGSSDSKKKNNGCGMSVVNVNNNNSDKSKIKCYRCKSYGHYKNQCQSNSQQTDQIK